MVDDQTNGLPPREESKGMNELTRIHSRIHCAATRGTLDCDELQSISIDHFLDELAEIALAIVRRREQPTQ